MQLIIDTDRCYSCRTCQLICSFHHTGAFWPEKSSIRVYRNQQNGFSSWEINSTCDACRSELEPQCIKYCVYGAIRSA